MHENTIGRPGARRCKRSRQPAPTSLPHPFRGRHRLVFVLLAALWLPPAAAHAAVQVPTWRIPYLPGPVKVDGRLDDPQYAKAFRWDRFVQTEPGDNTRPSRESVLYLFTTDDALIIGVRCFDPHPEQIRRTRYRRDQGMDEHLEIFLDAFGTGKQMYFIGISPMNDVMDGTYDPVLGSFRPETELFCNLGACLCGQPHADRSACGFPCAA